MNRPVTWIKAEENKALLRRLVVQFQSEWDGSEPDKRWGWVKEMWAKPVKHNTEALKRKNAWIEAQKANCTKALPKLELRVARAKGWRKQVATLQADANKALEDAKQAVADAKKAKEDFGPEAQATVEPLTPADKHKKAVDTQKVALTKAMGAALEARKQAEAKPNEFPPMLARADAWIKREEAKYDAADGLIALADPLIAEVQKNLEETSKKTEDPNAADQATKDFEDYKNYMKALQFWEQVPGLPKSDVWHFHPLAFIEFFKKCHWLSKGELAAIYPDDVYEAGIDPVKTRNTHRLALNRVMWKYGVTTSIRQTHFCGQGGHESAHLGKMVEAGNDAYIARYDFNGDLGNFKAGDGKQFRGRGMKQLTGRYNYMRYWVYRGWLPASWMAKKWTLNKKEKALPEDERKKIEKTLVAPPEINDPGPETLKDVSFNAIDVGGWFWEAGANSHRSINQRFREGPLDSDDPIDKASKDINPSEGADMLKKRREETYRVYDVVGDDLEPKSKYFKDRKNR